MGRLLDAAGGGGEEEKGVEGGKKLTDWFGVFDLEHVGWRRADGVVGIGQETGIGAAVHFLAGFVEGGLGEGVVHGHEGEFDHVAWHCGEGVWAEDEAWLAAYCDLEAIMSGCMYSDNEQDRRCGEGSLPCVSRPCSSLAVRSAQQGRFRLYTLR